MGGGINDEREKAKFPTVNENDIEAELKKHRNKIAKLVDSKISKLDKTSYVKLITYLADDCFANQNYDDGEFLNELFDLYDLNIREDIEKAQNRVDAIRQSIYGDEKSLSTEIDDLIKVTKEWDSYAQPLQLRAMSQGYDHEESYALARKLRDLSLYINNDQHKPFEALKLTEALKDIFAELPEMSDKFNEDITILKKLALNEYLALILQKSEEIKKLYYIQNSSIEDLLRIVDEWHKFSIENRLEDEKISNKTVAEYLRTLAVELHNNKSRVDLALLITKKLKDIFTEFSDIQNKLNDDYLSLSKNAEVIVNSITNTTRVLRNNADENKDNLSNLEIIICSIIGGAAGAGGCLGVFAFTFALISVLLKVLFGLDVTSINIGGPGIDETLTFLWIVFAVFIAVSIYKDRKK